MGFYRATLSRLMLYPLKLDAHDGPAIPRLTSAGIVESRSQSLHPAPKSWRVSASLLAAAFISHRAKTSRRENTSLNAQRAGKFGAPEQRANFLRIVRSAAATLVKLINARLLNRAHSAFVLTGIDS